MDLEELWDIVRSVPPGKVASYGAVGRALRRPGTGWAVGRSMARCPSDVPWWRIVAQSGALPVSKRDPRLAWEQRNLLLREGVAFEGDLVSPDAFWEP